MSIEKKAHEAHDANRALKEKYHIPYNCWIDWFTLGYRRAEADTKQKAIETYKNTCSFSPDGCCMMKKEAGKCDCDNLKDFIEELNS